MATISIPPSLSYQNAPFTSIRLDLDGKRIIKSRVTVDIRGFVPKIPHSVFQTCLYAVLRFCNCPSRYQRLNERRTVEVAGDNFAMGLKARIKDLYPHGHTMSWTVVECDDLEKDEPAVHVSDPRLNTSIQAALASQGINAASADIELALKARTQALKARMANPLNVISVSSRNLIFVERNSVIRTSNAAPHEPTSLCLASVRVFPDGSSDMTIPSLERVQGGFNRIYCDAFISKEGAVHIVRRHKLLKERRSPKNFHYFQKVYDRIRHFDHPNILVPKFFFWHATKGIQCLTDNCTGDLTKVLQPYYDVHKDEVDKTTSPVYQQPMENQVRDCIRYMREITLAMQYVYDEGFLHCDCNLGNVLMERRLDGSFTCRLADFGHCLTREEGEKNLDPAHGSPRYIKPDYLKRDLLTEFYALGQTFSLEPFEGDNASLILMLLALEKRAIEQGNPLAPRITALKNNIISLAEELTSGLTADDVDLSYPYVLSKLEEYLTAFETLT